MLHANLVSVFLQMQNSAAQELRASAPQASQAFPQLSVGQALTATIVSRLAGGLFLADIQGQRIQLALPANVVSGDTVSLRVLRAEPDYVFELLPRAGTSPGVEHRPSTALSQGAQIIQLALADARAPLPASLSTAAPLLASAPEAGAVALPPGSSALRPGATATLSAASAVQGAPTGGFTPAQQLAAALRDTIVNSGLFYESHLSDWVHGQRSLAELRREPQGEWNPTRSATGGAPNPASPRQDSGERALAVAPDARTDPARTLAAGVPEQARPILRQQLETLETRQFAWQGPVWPGQQVTLTIAEDPASHADGQGSASWRTTLDLSLPQLGAIHADLAAAGETLTISIAAPDSGTARILRSGLPALDERLRSAGLRPHSIMVAGDD
jgi:hypothetical protein